MRAMASTRIKQTVAGALIASGLSLTGSAHASTVFDFADFTGACGASLTCVGTTAAAGTALRLTTPNSFVGGAAYSTNAISLGSGATFSTTFKFRFTQPGGIDPADGIVFVLATQTAGLGTTGFGIGYAGLAGGSAGIEFDTYNNGGSDLSSNHVAVDVNGALSNLNSTNPYGIATCDFSSGGIAYQSAGCMSNGDVWSVTIGYDGTSKQLTVAMQDGAMAAQTVLDHVSLDLATLLGQNTAYIGFTSATGAGWENHDILSWQLASDISLAQPPVPPTTGVPEPLSIGLFGIGLVGLAGVRRRRTKH